MRRVERPLKEPDVLLTKGEKERTEATSYFGPPRKSKDAFPFAIYKHKEVKAGLEKLFHGKCAYCETFYASGQPMDVEHYRPKGAVEGEKGHTGYWWIAMSWTNLLPSCIDCNRKRNQITPKGDVSQVRLLEDSLKFSHGVTMGSGKKDSFPLSPGGVRATKPDDNLADEKPLLLNPCEDSPDEHLEFMFASDDPVSFVVPKRLATFDPDEVGANGLSLKGATSIHVYGLNRLGLVQARTAVLRHLEFLGKLVIDMKSLSDDLANSITLSSETTRAATALSGFADNLIAEMKRMAAPGMPYSAMVSAWLEQYARRIAETR